MRQVIFLTLVTLAIMKGAEATLKEVRDEECSTEAACVTKCLKEPDNLASFDEQDRIPETGLESGDQGNRGWLVIDPQFYACAIYYKGNLCEFTEDAKYQCNAYIIERHCGFKCYEISRTLECAYEPCKYTVHCA